MAESIIDKCLCLSLTFDKVGTTRKLKASQFEVNADKRLVSAHQRLLQSPELKAIGDADLALRRWIESVALPAPMFRHSVYLVATGSVARVEARVTEYTEVERPDLVEKFIGVYEDLVNEDQRRMPGIFNPAYYPPRDAVAREFGVRASWFAFGAPQAGLVKAELFRTQVEEAAAEVRAVLRESLAELVEHLADSLGTPGPNGRPRRLYDSAVTKLQGFLDELPGRDLTDDSALAVLAQDLRSLVSGIEPDEFRRDKPLRTRVAAALTEVKTQLDTLVAERPSRLISFEDEA